MSKEIVGEKRIFFGVDKESLENIYINKPTWDCEWYWSFGYLGNSNNKTHYHLDGYAKRRNINIFDALNQDYHLNSVINDKLWLFCELSKTIYQLKESAEMFGRGGMHYTSNPYALDIKNEALVAQINNVLLPKILQGFWDEFGVIE